MCMQCCGLLPDSLPMFGKFITGWCIWKGNQKAESQRQRMEAKLHAYHQQKGGTSVPTVSFRNF